MEMKVHTMAHVSIALIPILLHQNHIEVTYVGT
jgi:hypothetical protein